MKLLEMIRFAMLLIIPVIVFAVIITGRKRDLSDEQEYLLGILKSRGGGKNKYIARKTDEMNLFLSQYGAEYNLGISRVWQFMALKFICMAGVFITALQLLNPIFSFMCSIFGYLFPNFLVRMLNKADNENMFSDLKALYDTLRIQQSAGIYITNAILDCYLVVKSKRLKSALKQVSSDILSDKDIVRAVSTLTVKFRNDYIDEFVTIISQSVQTGQMIKILEEINKQMMNIEDVMNGRKEAAIDRKMMIIQILLFIGILAAAVYGLAVSGAESVYNF